jgi:hypothetical protein
MYSSMCAISPKSGSFKIVVQKNLSILSMRAVTSSLGIRNSWIKQVQISKCANTHTFDQSCAFLASARANGRVQGTDTVRKQRRAQRDKTRQIASSHTKKLRGNQVLNSIVGEG